MLYLTFFCIKSTHFTYYFAYIIVRLKLTYYSAVLLYISFLYVTDILDNIIIKYCSNIVFAYFIGKTI